MLTPELKTGRMTAAPELCGVEVMMRQKKSGGRAKGAIIRLQWPPGQWRMGHWLESLQIPSLQHFPPCLCISPLFKVALDICYHQEYSSL